MPYVHSLKFLFLYYFLQYTAADEGLSGKFRNLAARPVKLWWVSHTGVPQLNGVLDANGGETSFQTYTGHSFMFSESHFSEDGGVAPVPITSDGAEGSFVTVSDDQLVYVFRDASTDPELVQALETELEFMASYYNRTGSHWLAYYPRQPPIFPMWEAKEFGQKHEITLSQDAQYWLCERDVPECRSTDVKLEIEVISLKPRAFAIKNLMTDFECTHVIKTSINRMERSTTGTGDDESEDDVRTSDSAWLSRSQDMVTETIYRRAAEVFRMPPNLFWPHKNSESINVLRYEQGGQYTPHYDWGSHGSHESRFISMLLYFNTPEKGGTTSFPKGIKQDGSTYIRHTATKGDAMFFYDLLEDGNVDDYSLHAGEPVESGEKWVGAMWIWEPNVMQGDEPWDEVKRYYGSQEDVHRSKGWMPNHQEL